jgi:hypothetical protein
MTALHVLEADRFIRNDRGWIVIRDRKGLEEFAGDAYGKPETEYRRLIGPFDTLALRLPACCQTARLSRRIIPATSQS